MSADSGLDNILTEVGAFGIFHVVTYTLICFSNILSTAQLFNFMISADTIDYRCKVPECDVGENNREIQYDQSWLKYTIPSENGKFESCTHYAVRNKTEIDAPVHGQCSAEMFDTSKRVECSEYVYASDEKNVQTKFNIHCKDSYKLALIGSTSSVARFISLPMTGLLSDRFGRLTLVVIGMVLSSILGIIKSFSMSYSMYISLEFLQVSAGACTYTCAYVLAIELMNSKYRVFGGTIMSLSHSVGETLLGVVAMYVHDFQILIWICHIPGLFLFTYFWLVPESIRWLLITGRVDRAIQILKRAAEVNGKQLSEKSIEVIKSRYNSDATEMNSSVDKEKGNESQSLTQSLSTILRTKRLSLRLLICCYQWAACTFSYHGLSMSATHIPGADRYVSFIFVMASGIPGVLVAQLLLYRMKRRILLFTAMSLTAVSITATSFVPEEHSVIVLLLYIFGKASITCAYTSLYVFTAEQWPTGIRSTIMNSCSMVGRIGAMLAPLTVIVGAQYDSLPALLFGSTAIIGAISVLFSPETFSKELPDTIEEAENL